MVVYLIIYGDNDAPRTGKAEYVFTQRLYMWQPTIHLSSWHAVYTLNYKFISNILLDHIFYTGNFNTLVDAIPTDDFIDSKGKAITKEEQRVEFFEGSLSLRDCYMRIDSYGKNDTWSDDVYLDEAYNIREMIPEFIIGMTLQYTPSPSGSLMRDISSPVNRIHLDSYAIVSKRIR